MTNIQGWFSVRVTMDDGFTFDDLVWATSEEESLVVAYWNWECADLIEAV